jgi:hypothetical protein
MAVLLAAVIHPVVSAFNDERPLVGRTRMQVFVDLRPDAKQCGLTVPQVQSDVENKLKRAGVVVAPKVPGEYPTMYLWVTVIVLRIPSGCTFTVSVEFVQDVFLPDKAAPNLPKAISAIIATTWNDSLLSFIPGIDGPGIRDTVGLVVDRFVNDWLRANPPEDRKL